MRRVPDQRGGQSRQPRAGARARSPPARARGRRPALDGARRGGSRLGCGHAAPVFGAALRALEIPRPGAQQTVPLHGARAACSAPPSASGSSAATRRSGCSTSAARAARRRARTLRRPRSRTTWRRRHRSSTCCRRRTTACTRGCFSRDDSRRGGFGATSQPFTIIQTTTTHDEPDGPGVFDERRRAARARLHGSAPSPSASAGRSAAARPRCCSRSAGRCATTTTSPSSPTTSSRGRTPSSWCGNEALAAERIARSRPAAVRTRRSATTSARTWTRWSS